MRRRKLLLTSFVLVTFVAAGVFARLQLASETDPPAVEADVSKATACKDLAKSFRDYALIWLGDEFSGLKLTTCMHDVSPAFAPSGTVVTPATDSFTFIYGDCEPPPGVPSCPAPLQITIQSPCDALIPLAESVKREKHSVRGAVADVMADGTLVVVVDEVRVSVFSPGDSYEAAKSASISAVENLRGVNDVAADLTLDGDLKVNLKKGTKVCS